MINTNIYKTVLSKENIYRAIYCIDSYIFEKELLNEDDLAILFALRDKFNFSYINEIIKKVQDKIEAILIDDELFDITVYFRPKKFDKGQMKFRPLHTADIITQIAIVSMLNIVIFDYSKDSIDEKVCFSDLIKLIPENFYGNIPSLDAKYLFKPWAQMYKKFSTESTEYFSSNLESNEYAYEVSLDLINFFPSINPCLILNIISEALSINYPNEESIALKKILFKLLYFNVNNIDGCEELYYGNSSKIVTKYSLGIVQGLPQAYLFGNICMTEVAKIFDEVFKGKSFYYVDDSLIYTNNTNLNDFKNDLKIIKTKLSEFSIIKKYNNIMELSDKHSKDIITFSKQMSKSNIYKIEVHPEEGKSSCSKISTIKEEKYLNALSKEASIGAIALNRSFSDTEDVTLYNKFKTLTISIEKEIERLDLADVEYEYYKKLLIRFKKFFKFRFRMIEYRMENGTNFISENIQELCDSMEVDDSNIDNPFKKFFTKYDEDIFLTEFRYILENFDDSAEITKIENSLHNFNTKVFESCVGCEKYSYYLKLFNGILQIKKINKAESYDSLRIAANLYWADFKNAHDEVKNQKAKDIVRIISPDANKQIYEYLNKLKLTDDNTVADYVMSTSTNLHRMVLNAIFSKTFNVFLTDDLQIVKLDSKPLKHIEFKVLVYLRNSTLDLNDFFRYISQIDFASENSSIDYTIYEAVEYFKKYVTEPNLIDNLIRIHKYTSDVWKNGSKFLHFYTLHNHEHALELIKKSTKIVNSIDFINLKSIDYYILFISCYLHDISMVLHPDLNKIFNSRNEKALTVFSKFRDDVHTKSQNQSLYLMPDCEIGKLLVNYYNKLDSFFENYVRDTHAKKSSDFIRNSREIDFIDKAYKELIAKVSEAHGYDVADIYKTKSNAKTTLFSEKYLKIILRLADVLDISKDRITTPILNNNIEHMSDISKFHWLSHNIIKDCKIVVEYKNRKIKPNIEFVPESNSFIGSKVIREIINIEITVNNTNITKCQNLKKCEYVFLSNNNLKKDIELKIKINKNDKLNENEVCKTDCSLICKWLAKKNEYLYQELYSLQEYLNNNKDNYFMTEIRIKIIFSGKDSTTKSQLNFMKNFLEPRSTI